MLGRLLALQHGDSAFPNGAFAFSNGIEALAALGPLNEEALTRVVTNTILYRWASFDRVALVMAHRTGLDLKALNRLDTIIEASSLSETLRIGSRRQGQSFLAAHQRMGTPGAAALRAAIHADRMLGHIVTVQGVIWRELGLAEDEAVAISGYQTVSNLTNAAVRLGQIGAIEAQKVIAAVLPRVTEAAAGPVPALGQSPVPDDLPLTSFIPLIEIAAARHAGADLRLFSN